MKTIIIKDIEYTIIKQKNGYIWLESIYGEEIYTVEQINKFI